MLDATAAGEIVFRAVQSTHESDDDLEGSALVGIVLVAEWLDPSGKRWLSRLSFGPNDEGLTTWQVNGYLHEALHNWPEDDE